MIPAGTRIPAPSENGGYEVVEDIYPESPVATRYFKGYGTVPEPKESDVIPHWLSQYIRERL